jgi:hypothetical protein
LKPPGRIVRQEGCQQQIDGNYGISTGWNVLCLLDNDSPDDENLNCEASENPEYHPDDEPYKPLGEGITTEPLDYRRTSLSKETARGELVDAMDHEKWVS